MAFMNTLRQSASTSYLFPAAGEKMPAFVCSVPWAQKSMENALLVGIYTPLPRTADFKGVKYPESPADPRNPRMGLNDLDSAAYNFTSVEGFGAVLVSSWLTRAACRLQRTLHQRLGAGATKKKARPVSPACISIVSGVSRGGLWKSR